MISHDNRIFFRRTIFTAKKIIYDKIKIFDQILYAFILLNSSNLIKPQHLCYFRLSSLLPFDLIKITLIPPKPISFKKRSETVRDGNSLIFTPRLIVVKEVLSSNFLETFKKFIMYLDKGYDV